MKLLEQRNLVKVEGDVEFTKFKINMSGKVARMLSDQLYSDKIKAVLRELGTNAYDSHVMAGKKNVPIEITLPSYMSPTCIIQDFGVGLSPDQIQNIYTVYGQSDKDNSNSVIGCLGIGSKSIFAYGTKSATIEDNFNGTKYIYTAMLGEDNVPVLAKLSESKTQESNGVKITLPVNHQDISNFQIKAKEVYEFFEVKPIFKGNTISFEKRTEVVKGTGWVLYSSGHCSAKMGGIAYNISFDDSSLSSEERKMLGHPFYIDFNIGDLDIEISREGLSYDVRTKSQLTAKFKLIRSELADKVNADIDQCKTLWEARLKASENSSILYEYVNKAKLAWKGQKLFPSAGYHTQLELPINTVSGPNGTTTKVREKIQQYSTYYRSAKNFKPSDCTTIEINREVKFIVRDLDKGTDSRVLLATNNGSLSTRRLYLIEPTQKTMILDLLGCDDDSKMFILASSLPKPVPKVRVAGTKRGNTDNVMELQSGGYNLTSYYKNVEKDLDEGGKYFEFNTFRCVYAGASLKPNYVVELRESLVTCGIKQDETIYAIKTAQIKKLAKTKKPWVNYLDYAFAELDKAYAKLAYTNLEHTAKLFNKFFGMFDSQKYKYVLSHEKLIELKKHVIQKDFLDFVAKIEVLETINRQNEVRKAIESAYNNVGRKVPALTGTPKDVKADCDVVKTTYWDILKKYPLLGILANSSDYDIKEIAIYVNAK